MSKLLRNVCIHASTVQMHAVDACTVMQHAYVESYDTHMHGMHKHNHEDHTSVSMQHTDLQPCSMYYYIHAVYIRAAHTPSSPPSIFHVAVPQTPTHHSQPPAQRLLHTSAFRIEVKRHDLIFHDKKEREGFPEDDGDTGLLRVLALPLVYLLHICRGTKLVFLALMLLLDCDTKSVTNKCLVRLCSGTAKCDN